MYLPVYCNFRHVAVLPQDQCAHSLICLIHALQFMWCKPQWRYDYLTWLVCPLSSQPPNMYMCPFRKQPQAPDMEGGTSPVMWNTFLQKRKKSTKMWKNYSLFVSVCRVMTVFQQLQQVKLNNTLLNCGKKVWMLEISRYCMLMMNMHHYFCFNHTQYTYLMVNVLTICLVLSHIPRFHHKGGKLQHQQLTEENKTSILLWSDGKIGEKCTIRGEKYELHLNKTLKICQSEHFSIFSANNVFSD